MAARRPGLSPLGVLALAALFLAAPSARAVRARGVIAAARLCVRQAGKRSQPRDALPDALRRRLSRELAGDVHRLEALLDRDLAGWIEPDVVPAAMGG